MSLTDNIKNEQIKKIIFVELTYIDTATYTQKKVYYSDSFCEIPKNLISGATMTPELRLKKVPNFNREIDIIENNSVLTSNYTIQLENVDKSLNTFFYNNLFTNQEFNIYITTENDLNPFSCKKICSARIDQVEISNDLSIKLKELLLLETELDTVLLEKYAYENQDSSLDDTYKPIISGKQDLFKVENINKINSSDFTDSKLLVDVVANTSYLRVRCQSDLDAEKLRYMIKIGDLIKLPNATGMENTEFKYVSFSTINYREFYFEGFSLNNYTATELWFKNDDNYLFNNKFLISKNKTTTRKSSDITTLYNGSTSTSYIIPAETWDFIRQGDYIYVENKSNSLEREYFYVASYDKATNKIYLDGDKFSSYPASGTWSINMDYVNSIRVKLSSPDKYIDLKREARLFSVNVPLYSDIIQTNTYAKISNLLFNESSNVKLTFTSTRIGMAGNADKITFENEYDRTIDPSYVRTINGSYDPIITTTSNLQNGNDIHVLYWYDRASNIGTTVNQIKILTYPNITVTSSGTLSNYAKDVTNVQQQLKGGYSNGTYFIVNYALGFTQSGELPFLNYISGMAVWFDKGSNTLPDSLNGYSGLVIKITVLNTDTTADVTTKIINAINANRSDYFGLVAYSQNSGYVAIKDMYITNAKMDIIGSNLTANTLKGSKRSFSIAIENTDELVLNIDRVGLNIEALDFKESFIFNPVKVLGTAGLNNAQKRAIYYNNTDSGDTITLDGFEMAYNMQANNQVYNASLLSYVDKILSFDKVIVTQNTDTKEIVLSDYIAYKTDAYNIPMYILNFAAIENVYVNYKDENIHVADNLNYLFDLYNITKFNASDLTTIKTNHDNFDSFIHIKDQTAIYKLLNEFNLNFNLITYTDQNGDIRVKFLDLYDVASPTTIDYYNTQDIIVRIDDLKYNKVIYKINKDNFNDVYTDITITDSILDSIASLLKINKEQSFETGITKNIFSNSFNSHTYTQHFTNRYFRKFMTVELYISLDNINIDILDNIKISNCAEILDTDIFKVYKIETDFKIVKISCFKLI